MELSQRLNAWKPFFKVILSIVLFFAILVPTSHKSTEKDFGKLIRQHKRAQREYKDDYITILAISTINTNNNLTDEYKIPESISYLRRLNRNKYRLETYSATVKNEDGSFSTETRTRKVLISSTAYQGEALIQFSCEKFEITKEELLDYSTYKSLLKFHYIFPDEEPAPDIVIEYTLDRLDAKDIIYDNEGKQAWFDFLIKEGIKNIYLGVDDDPMGNQGEGYIEAPDLGMILENPIDPSRREIIDFAMKFLGKPYKWGAAVGDTSCFDCSSFTSYVYREVYKINLDRVSYQQYSNAPYQIKKESLRTGDLVFFYTGAGNTFNPITHVGIYIGEGKFINAAGTDEDGSVRIDSLLSPYWAGAYRGAGRYIP